MASEAVTHNDKKLLQIIGGEKLLITIIFVGTVLLFFILWANRHVSRLFLISKKGPHTTPVGSDAPKKLKKLIERYFNLISKIRPEPKLLCDQGQGNKEMMSSYVEQRDEGTFVYRRKAFDLMSCLDDLLCRVDVCLACKPGKTKREHFEVLQNPPYAPFLDCKDLCERVAERYEHARYSSKPFDLQDYEAFAEDMATLTQKVHNTLMVPGSLLVPSARATTSKSQSHTSSLFDRDQSQGLLNLSNTKQDTEVILRKTQSSNYTPIPV
eukprot:gene525-1176_t